MSVRASKDRDADATPEAPRRTGLRLVGTGAAVAIAAVGVVMLAGWMGQRQEVRDGRVTPSAGPAALGDQGVAFPDALVGHRPPGLSFGPAMRTSLAASDALFSTATSTEPTRVVLDRTLSRWAREVARPDIGRLLDGSTKAEDLLGGSISIVRTPMGRALVRLPALTATKDAPAEARAASVMLVVEGQGPTTYLQFVFPDGLALREMATHDPASLLKPRGDAPAVLAESGLAPVIVLPDPHDGTHVPSGLVPGAWYCRYDGGDKTPLRGLGKRLDAGGWSREGGAAGELRARHGAHTLQATVQDGVGDASMVLVLVGRG